MTAGSGMRTVVTSMSPKAAEQATAKYDAAKGSQSSRVCDRISGATTAASSPPASDQEMAVGLKAALAVSAAANR